MSRSQPGADRQAADLRAAGHDPVVAPVLAVEPLDAPLPEGPFQYVIFVSEHAVRLGLPRLAEALPLPRLRVLAVGARTAALLEAQGIAASAPEDATSEGLLALPELERPAGQRILLVTGEGGRGLLAPELSQRGAEVVRFDCYRRVPVAPLNPAVLDCDAVIAASGDGLRQLAQAWLGAGGRRDVAVLVPSARVARLGVELGLTNLHDCGGADSDAWLRGLEQLQTGTS